MARDTGKKFVKRKRRSLGRQRSNVKYTLPEGADIDYKNVALLQKFIDSRGKIVPRRLSGITAKDQRKLSSAIKQARHMALLTTGGVKKT